MDLLRTAYYEVDYTAGAAAGTCYWDTLDPNKLAALNAADLVIIGRDTRVADLAADATTVAAWNGLRTPVLLMNSYLAANDAWQWVNSRPRTSSAPTTICLRPLTPPIRSSRPWRSISMT